MRLRPPSAVLSLLACVSVAAPALGDEPAFTPARAASTETAGSEAATSLATLTAGPLDLLAALHLADEHDPNLAAVRASRKAADSTTDIARSVLLPRLVASGSDSQVRLTQNTGQQTDYRSTQYQVKLSQPLFHLDAFHQFQAAKAQFTQAQAAAADQTQSLLLAVAEVYFSVLRAEDALALAQAQEAALNKQRDLAQGRFEVGLAARSDVIEAEAQRDNAIAQRLSAEIAVVNARETLNAAIGRRVDGLAHLRENLPVDAPLPDDAEAWATLARERNPGLVALRAYAAAAESGRAVAQAAYLPQVDLFVSYGDRNNGNSTNPAVFFNSGTQQIYGIEAQWELFAGGRTRAQTQQAGYTAEAARQQALAREHQVVNQARTGFLTVKSDATRLQARQRARDSAQLAYDSVKAGYEVGTRNIVDLLLAETNLFAARRDYANARYDYVIDSLRLHAATGQLDEPLVTRINGWLAP